MLTNEMLTKYYDLVQNNCHGEVLEGVSRDFKLKNYITIFKSINTIHNLEGSLSHDLLLVRDRMKMDMFDHLKRLLTNEEYDAITAIV